jgi:hypothetical protein
VDAPQLLKHILGLTVTQGSGGFRLLYLWYEAPGGEAQRHRAEIEEFTALAQADGVDFRSLTYQEAIARLAAARDEHRQYVDYVAERYL